MKIRHRNIITLLLSCLGVSCPHCIWLDIYRVIDPRERKLIIEPYVIISWFPAIDNFPPDMWVTFPEFWISSLCQWLQGRAELCSVKCHFWNRPDHQSLETAGQTTLHSLLSWAVFTLLMLSHQWSQWTNARVTQHVLLSIKPTWLWRESHSKAYSMKTWEDLLKSSWLIKEIFMKWRRENQKNKGCFLKGKEQSSLLTALQNLTWNH